MSMIAPRNREGLSARTIERCIELWKELGGEAVCPLDSSGCSTGSKTVFVQRPDKAESLVRLGADVLPDPRLAGLPVERFAARQRLSMAACLAHELAHAQRYLVYEFDRTTVYPDVLLDEAEASIHASFNLILDETDRRILIKDAQEQLNQWLTEQTEKENSP